MWKINDIISRKHFRLVLNSLYPKSIQNDLYALVKFGLLLQEVRKYGKRPGSRTEKKKMFKDTRRHIAALSKRKLRKRPPSVVKKTSKKFELTGWIWRTSPLRERCKIGDPDLPPLLPLQLFEAWQPLQRINIENDTFYQRISRLFESVNTGSCQLLSVISRWRASW